MVALLNHWGREWLEYFGPLLVQNTLFLGLVFLALYLFRRAPAKIKYAISMVGLVKLLLPTFIPIPFITGPIITGGIIGSVPFIGPITAVSSPAGQQVHLSFQAILLILWIILTLGVLLFPLLSLMRLKTRLRSSEPIELDTNTAHPAVKIYKSDKIAMPLTVGLFPDRLFVPKLWDKWSVEYRRMIIQHELAHIKRRDGLVNFIQIVVQAIYFFHPLIWLLGRRMAEFREMACDDIIVNGNKASSLAYSRFLADVAENIMVTQPGYITVTALIKQKNELLNRVKYQLEDTMRQYSKIKTGLVMAVLLTMILPLSLTYSAPDVDSLTPVVGKKNNLPVIQSQDSHETGKIYGTVTDEQSGEPLPGTDIVVEGTGMGAAADKNGQFFIINVSPGAYKVKASMMGYATVVFNAVKVETQESKELDFSLKRTIIRIDGDRKDYSPPPTLTDSDKDDIVFIPYDVPPEPVGGYAAIQKRVVYPDIARKAGVQGMVVVKAFVNAEGEVTETGILEGIPNSGLNGAAMDALKRTRFIPAIQRDRNIGVWIAVPINFKLGK